MKTEEVLLIGGSQDGRRMSVMTGTPYLEFYPQSESSQIIELNDSSADAMPGVFTAEVYVRHVLHDQGRPFIVFAVEGAGVIPSLIAGYRRETA